MREELPGVHWLVPCVSSVGKVSNSLCNRTRAYGVRRGGCLEEVRLSSHLAIAIVIASFTKAKSMNAVVTMGAINAAYLSCSNDNSGLPLNWRGGLLTKKAVSTVETLGFPQLGDTQH